MKLDDSFWEPDNDRYPDPPTPTREVPQKMVKIVASSPIKPLDEKEREARRQSIEEFIEMGMSNPGSSPTKPIHYDQDLDQVHIPPLRIPAKKVIKPNSIEKLEKSSTVPYAGIRVYSLSGLQDCWPEQNMVVPKKLNFLKKQ